MLLSARRGRRCSAICFEAFIGCLKHPSRHPCENRDSGPLDPGFRRMTKDTSHVADERYMEQPSGPHVFLDLIHVKLTERKRTNAQEEKIPLRPRAVVS